LAIVDRWRAWQGGAVGAGLIAPAVRARPALTDGVFAITLKTQRYHPLADLGKIVGGARCMRLQLFGHAPVMPEDGCSTVKTKTKGWLSRYTLDWSAPLTAAILGQTGVGDPYARSDFP
jgi:hypothetical protein